MSIRLPRELKILHSVVRSLAEINGLKEVKALRDKAEAARKYAQSAALSREFTPSASGRRIKSPSRGNPHGLRVDWPCWELSQSFSKKLENFSRF